VFRKVIQANGEKQDADIMTMFCFTLRDAISKWGENFMHFPLGYTFSKLEAPFYKPYRIVQNDEHVYMAF
jgi:hypothetical protein